MMKRALLCVFLLGCKKTPAAPDAAAAIASATASTSAPAASVSIGLVIAPKPVGDRMTIVQAWNDATNAHDATKLSALYADDVELYGTVMTRAKAVAIKQAAFAKHDRDDLDYLTISNDRAGFVKKSKAKDGKVITVSGYLVIDDSMKITAEGDMTTDANLVRKKSNQCVDAIAALVASTPEGKAAGADIPRASAWKDDRAADPWHVQYFTYGGTMPDGTRVVLCCPDEFEVDSNTYVVTQRGGKVVTPDPAAVAKASALCK